MNNLKQLIIIGGGSSISEGVSKELWDKLKGRFVIGLNYCFHHYKDATFYSWVDNDFYRKQIENLKSLPLLIGAEHPELKKVKLPNTITLPSTARYDPTLKKGVYKLALVGLWALSLGCYLLKDIEDAEIYLLGFDFGGKNKKDRQGRFITHYYQGKINHRGISKVSFYNNKEHRKKCFQPFIEKQSISIYNISLISKIPQFPKISYDQFFRRLDNKLYNQDNLREWVKKRIGEIK